LDEFCTAVSGRVNRSDGGGQSIAGDDLIAEMPFFTSCDFPAFRA
jgi:hypothetical protein